MYPARPAEVELFPTYRGGTPALLRVIFVFTMAITREKKETIVQDVKRAVESASSVVFVRFHKLTVADVATLRDELRKEGVRYLVAKKTLIRRALADRKVDGALPELEGEIALAYGPESLAPARLVETFAKKHPGNLSIVGGIFEGAYLESHAMREIANIPSLTVLYSQIANLVRSPLQGLVIALDQIAQKK